MNRQPHRLPAGARHGFGGGAIDRSKPLTFRLNGTGYDAFEGDTVLSALLAAGVDAAGTYNGEPIALDERFAPPVAPRRLASDPAAATAMDRLPVVAGLDLVTIGPLPAGVGGFTSRLRRLVTRRGTTLGHRLDDPRLLEGTWLHLAPAETIEADTIVVGGGIAGMSAALAAAAAGGRVLLVERRTTLGGDARFFGTVGDEPAPETTIAELSARIAKTPSITVFTSTDAFNIAGARVRVHQVRIRDGKPEARVLRLAAPRIVLATGAAERLPIFSGNRAPRVTGAVAAFHRAERYGVWLGKRAIIATPHNVAYRLGLLAADAGITVQRVADSRPMPQSRFIDFSKASGITLASGLAIRAAEPATKGGDPLAVSFTVSIEDASGESAPMPTDLLVAAGGWQPRIALWLIAGGGTEYDPAQRWLAARGSLEGVRLAGAAAGYRSSGACLASGEQAVASLLGKSTAPIADIAADAVYESREGPTSIAPFRIGHGAAFLDAGLSFTRRPQQLKKDAPVVAPSDIHPLSLGDVLAAVEIGSIPSGEAGTIAAERCLDSGDIAPAEFFLPPVPQGSLTGIPPYLQGRLGPKPAVVVLTAADARNFEPGCLVYSRSDSADPLAAIGAVIGPAADGKGARAVVSRVAISGESALFVRDVGGAVAVKISEKLKTPTPAKPA